MLRYFYILVCIQLCFCTAFIDRPEYESFERRVRSKSTELHKEHTKSPKKSQLVQFDVQKFMQRADSDAVDGGPNYYRSVGRRNRRRGSRAANIYDSLAEPYGNHKERNAAADDFGSNDHLSKLNTRSKVEKDPIMRHFNFHSLVFDDKIDGKAHVMDKSTNNVFGSHLTEKTTIADPEKKCLFRHMKMPFFSFNKTTTKAKRQKKRKLFCFNCHRKGSPEALPFIKSGQSPEEPTNSKNDNANKNHFYDKLEVDGNKVNKRSYEYLCPKCIRQLLASLKRKTTAKAATVTHETKCFLKDSKSTKEKTTVQKVDKLEDNLRNRNNYYLSYLRKKRSDEERERIRRLKELDEVERKIENVHVTAPTFTRVSMNFLH